MAVADDDFGLLGRYANGRDEAAFAELVRRHVNLVYSAAARRVGQRQLAEDVTQAVFVILAKKAKSLRRSNPLSAWLLTTVRYAAANALKIEARRRRHERAAAAALAVSGACSANPSDVLVWQEIASELDDAVLKLSVLDRTAVLLRFFEDRPIHDIAVALNVTEGAAKQRLSRSVEKLRQRLERSGATFAPIGAAGLMTALAAHAVRAAPMGLVQSSCAAATGGAVAGAGITIAKGAITMMTWTKAKIAAALVASAMIAGTGGVISINRAVAQNTPAPSKAAAPAPARAKAKSNGPSLATAPPVVIQSVPASGSTDVDPATTEIKVTYSKDMADGSWSWSTWGEENYPKTTGKPHYEADKRTCVMPVQLQPGKFYAIWLNSQNFGNFRDAEGKSAVPYLLVFETKK
jgi:RNA polymerase sigma factor (sigma-70 family)